MQNRMHLEFQLNNLTVTRNSYKSLRNNRRIEDDGSVIFENFVYRIELKKNKNFTNKLLLRTLIQIFGYEYEGHLDQFDSRGLLLICRNEVVFVKQDDYSAIIDDLIRIIGQSKLSPYQLYKEKAVYSFVEKANIKTYKFEITSQLTFSNLLKSIYK